jgi:type I restriction enzyme S subunit
MKILKVGTIAYTCIASIGKIAITTAPSITNQQINSITVYENINNEFVYYALLELTPYIKSKLANTILPIINKTEFSKFEIKLPKQNEQQKSPIV